MPIKFQVCRIVILALAVATDACSGRGNDEPEKAADTSGAREVSDQSAGDRTNWQEQWRRESLAGKDAHETWKRFAESAKAELAKPGADPSDMAASSNALGATRP